MPFFPRVGFVSLFLTLRCHAFLGFYALIFHIPPPTPRLWRWLSHPGQRAGEEGYLSVPWLSSFPAQAAPISAPAWTPQI